jgi:hypothetical protein
MKINFEIIVEIWNRSLTGIDLIVAKSKSATLKPANEPAL